MDVTSYQEGNNFPKPDKKFALWYMGWSSLDRRTTLPMLPWLVAEIRRKSEKNECGPVQAREVELTLTPPLIRCVPAHNASSSVFIFEHKAQLISRFIHNSNDLSYFAYLIRSQPDNPESEMSCHVFKARDPNQVSEVISSIRQVSKVALKEDSRPKQEGDEAFYNSQKFEVLYCGKAVVAHKRALATLVDDCIDKFRQHEAERRRPRPANGHHGSGSNSSSIEAPPDLAETGPIGVWDPLTSVADYNGDDRESTKVEGAVNGAKAPGGLGGLPECIMEDSGFEEQQEFRLRCSSLAAGLQRRPREGGGKAPVRRRHASAPSHVQPSDAEKNRTMLFQVGRFEVNVISPETKTVVLEKNFKDISSCSQGIKQTDHFGFICRDPGESGQNQYVCYVFQCASESLVDEVMLTLKQAFSTAAALQSTKTQVQLCEACPMHDLHKLCERIEGLYPPRAKLAIQTFVSQLTDSEQVDIFERVQRTKPGTDQEENELVILYLRQLCEAKQKTHLHIGEPPQAAPNCSASDSSSTSGRFKLDILKNKARSSLTSSLENIFSRGASRMRGRLGSVGSFERQDDVPGDSPPGTPPGSVPHFPDEDPGGPQFRRRAHTFSHPPVKKKISFGETQPQTAKASLPRQQSLAPELLYSSHAEGRKRTSSGCSSDSLTFGTLPCTPRRVSWRQKIFLSVASPISKPPGSMEQPDGVDGSELLPLSPCTSAQDKGPLAGLLSGRQPSSGEGLRRSSAEYRALWKKAIHQQILLLRMEKENQRLEASRDELHIRKMKLDYQEVSSCSTEVQAVWEKMLSVPGRAKAQWDKEEIHRTLCQGVPKSRRGEVWHLLSQQHRMLQQLPSRQQPPDTPYQDLLKQLTTQQHSILVDLGRTFPTHPYFSAQLGAGQLSLYNLLKAYSLLDAEVGYCQGISFVAGVLLLHMGEEQAFDMLKFLMYDMGFRRQYRPDMLSLQVQMYQLSRLLHDYHRELFTHLEEQDICPSLYAAPWFLTLFASQFPLGFVARIFDFLFVQGTEVIFKVALCLLRSHEGEIMECDTFETIVDYLKTTIPNLTHAQMDETIGQVLEMDISKQLHAYEVEYHVLQDEMLETSPPPDDSDRLDRLEKTNAQLKKQNMDLLEKLQAARIKIQSLEVNMESFLSRESNMKHLIRSLEQEKASYLRTIERMRGFLPAEALSDVELTHMKPGSDSKAKAASKKL